MAFRRLLIIFFVFAFFNLKAQNPPSPTMCYLTVNQDSTITLFWTVSQTTDYDGFIIRRKIYDGQGVVNGTFNNIEIIADTSARFYRDTSTDYNTFAKPYLRSEQYLIATYKVVNDSIYYSLPSLVHNTIFLQGSYDFCQRTVFLNWNSYKNADVEKYIIWAKTDTWTQLTETQDTFYSFTPLPNKNYQFFISAVLNDYCGKDTSNSNIINLFTAFPVLPDDFYIISADFIDNQNVSFKFLISDFERIKDFYLISDKGQKILINHNQDSINVQVDTPAGYRLYAFDECGNAVDSSNWSYPIFLYGNQKDNKFHLYWTAYKEYDAGINFYEIWFKGENWHKIATTTDTFFNINLENLPNIENLQTIEFQVIAVEKSGNRYGVQGRSKSRILKHVLKPICYLPNAIRPNSNIYENRFFIPKITFYKSYHLLIFDEAGRIVFETSDPNQYFDGTMQGKPLPQGSYQYVLELTGYDNKKLIKKGIVNLVY